MKKFKKALFINNVKLEELEMTRCISDFKLLDQLKKSKYKSRKILKHKVKEKEDTKNIRENIGSDWQIYSVLQQVCMIVIGLWIMSGYIIQDVIDLLGWIQKVILPWTPIMFSILCIECNNIWKIKEKMEYSRKRLILVGIFTFLVGIDLLIDSIIMESLQIQGILIIATILAFYMLKSFIHHMKGDKGYLLLITMILCMLVKDTVLQEMNMAEMIRAYSVVGVGILIFGDVLLYFSNFRVYICQGILARVGNYKYIINSLLVILGWMIISQVIADNYTGYFLKITQYIMSEWEKIYRQIVYYKGYLILAFLIMGYSRPFKIYLSILRKPYCMLYIIIGELLFMILFFEVNVMIWNVVRSEGIRYFFGVNLIPFMILIGGSIQYYIIEKGYRLPLEYIVLYPAIKGVMLELGIILPRVNFWSSVLAIGITWGLINLEKIGMKYIYGSRIFCE